MMEASILDEIVLTDDLLQHTFGIDYQVIFYKFHLDLVYCYLKFIVNFMTIYIISQKQCM